MRLPGLPLEYWLSSMITAIAVKAGKPLAVDDFTNHLRKIGYARVKLEIDAGNPLKPGVLIRGRKGTFWQQFVCENLPVVCYRCGRMGHSDESCRFPDVDLSSDNSDCSLLPQNFVEDRGDATPENPMPRWWRRRLVVGEPSQARAVAGKVPHPATSCTQSYSEGEKGLGNGEIIVPRLVRSQFFIPALQLTESLPVSP